MSAEHTPLTNPEAEMGVVACCIVGGLTKTLRAMELLPSGAFMCAEAQEAWLVLESLGVAGKETDLATFAMEWPRYSKARLPGSVLEAASGLPSAENMPYFIDLVTEAFRRRQVAYAGQQLMRQASDAFQTTDQVIAEAEKTLFAQKIDTSSTSDGRLSAQILATYLEESHALHIAGKLSGIASGLSKLDAVTDGLQYGELSLIAARPSVGKTAIGLNIAEFACLECEVPTLFLTLEMSTRALMRRMLAASARLSLRALKDGSFMVSESGCQQAIQFFARVRRAPLWIHEACSGIDIVRLMAVIRRHVIQHGIRLVVVDYLQKVKPSAKAEKRTYEVAQVSEGLKSVAVSTNVALLALAQLNRSPVKDKPRPPKISDLADSGQIERDSDMIGLLQRTLTTDEITAASLAISKQRDGELGMVELSFNGRYQRFTQV